MAKRDDDDREITEAELELVGDIHAVLAANFGGPITVGTIQKTLNVLFDFLRAHECEEDD
jgi:hypothetical protein